jgi:hypothetical protein
MKRVKCRVCVFSDGKKCELKKEKVAQNKTRLCDLFEYAPEKVKVKTKPKMEYVPYHMTSAKAHKAHLKEREKQVLQESVEEKVAKLSNPDILSRFRSNAS